MTHSIAFSDLETIFFSLRFRDLGAFLLRNLPNVI